MNRLGTFELDVSLGDPLLPAQVKLAVQRHTTDDTGRVFVTPECSSFGRSRARSTPCKTSWTAYESGLGACFIKRYNETRLQSLSSLKLLRR